MKPVFIPPEVAAGVVLTGAQACFSYVLCNKISHNLKSNYDKKLPKAVPLFLIAIVIVMAGKTAQLQHRYNRVLAKGKAIAEENRRLRVRSLRKRG